MGAPIAPIASASSGLPVRTGVRLPDGSHVLRANPAMVLDVLGAVAPVACDVSATRAQMHAILNDSDERIAIACVDSPARASRLFAYELQALVDTGLAAADRENALWTPFLDALLDKPNGMLACLVGRMREDQWRAIGTRLTKLARWIGRQRRWKRVLPLCGFKSYRLRSLVLRSGNDLPAEVIAHLVGADISLTMEIGLSGDLNADGARWALEAFSRHADDFLPASEAKYFLMRCADELGETMDEQLALAEAVDAVRGGTEQPGVRHVRDDVISTFRRIAEREPVARSVLARFAAFRDPRLREFTLELLRYSKR